MFNTDVASANRAKRMIHSCTFLPVGLSFNKNLTDARPLVDDKILFSTGIVRVYSVKDSDYLRCI
jgi:hypothetical protein